MGYFYWRIDWIGIKVYLRVNYGVDRRVGYRELLVWYDVEYDRGFGEGNGNIFIWE